MISHAVEYLDSENCKCRKKLVDRLVEECSENIDEVKIAEMALFELRNDCKSSCTTYVVLVVINIGIGTYFIYYKHMNYDKKAPSKYDYVHQTSNY